MATPTPGAAAAGERAIDGWSVSFLALWFFVQLTRHVYQGAGYETPGAVLEVGDGALALLGYVWLTADRPRHHAVGDLYRGLGALCLVQLLLPMYLVQSRRLRGSLVVALWLAGVYLVASLLGLALGRLVSG